MSDCRHEKVVRRDDGSWHCDNCGEKFYHLDLKDSEKAEVTQ